MLLCAIFFTGFAISMTTSDPNQQILLSPLHEPNRKTIIRSDSNSVSGNYPLYELLSITTTSGSISIAIEPHPAASHDSIGEPAQLVLRSTSGTIDARFPTRDVPSRKYDARVSTLSGSIAGSFPLGRQAVIEAESGSIDGIEIVIVPLDNSSEATVAASRTLTTRGTNGSQRVRVIVDGLAAETETRTKWWEGMISTHTGSSGSIDVDYPSEWVGEIEVSSVSGSVTVSGPGVEILEESHGRIVARKSKLNHGSSDTIELGGKITCSSQSGSVVVRFV